MSCIQYGFVIHLNKLAESRNERYIKCEREQEIEMEKREIVRNSAAFEGGEFNLE